MNAVQQVGGFLTPYAFETITVSTVPIGFTASKIAPTASQLQRDLGKARAILVSVEAQTIRYTFDGTTPVAATTGHQAFDKDGLTFNNLQSMLNFRAVRDAGVDAKLQVTYLR